MTTESDSPGQRGVSRRSLLRGSSAAIGAGLLPAAPWSAMAADQPPLGTWPALLVTGAVWGLWHAPIILLGYDFARPDALGLALMVGGCMAYGVLIGWLRIRSASIWPSVFAHGAFNAAGGFAVLVLAAGSPADPAAAGPLGWVAWILMAAIALVLLLTRQFPARGAWAVPGVKRPQAEPTPS